MIFAAPWVLVALTALPLLWWLLRVTPPAPRSQTFPAIRLLIGIAAREETSARTPLWLLALRMLAAALVILALSGPVLDAGAKLAGDGPVLLVVDNGWASAIDWPRRMQAAGTVLDRAQREGRRAALLAIAPDANGDAPAITPPMPVPQLRARLAALVPQPWAPDRHAAAALLAGWHQRGAAIVYLADGLTDGPDFPRFAAVLAAAGAVSEICCDTPPVRLLLPPRAEADGLVARLAQAPQPAASTAAVLAQSGDGRTLARADIAVPAGTAQAEAPIVLPPELRNRLARLVLDGPASAGSVVLLDEQWRRRPVGLLAGGQAEVQQGGAEAPLTAQLYYLRRALAPYTELREGSVEQLLARDISVLILADRPLPEGQERAALTRWVEKGGLLIRFAGPRTAGQPQGQTDRGQTDRGQTDRGQTDRGQTDRGQADPLLPVTLLDGERQLGGALSWSQPAGLAPFPPGSPFVGLAVPAEVLVTRQVLAEPSAALAGRTWATLADGTPLVTAATRGAGRIVLFHVTANADWSNLPLSVLFVDMLRRLVQLSAGVTDTAGDAILAPAETLDGFGLPGTPPPAAAGLTEKQLASAVASPRHPPGLYGPENGRHALNLGTAAPAPETAPMVGGARVEHYSGAVPERALGPWLLVAGLVLLLVDLICALALRGLLRRPLAGTAVALALALALSFAPYAHAQDQTRGRDSNPALATRLASIVTGDAAVDATAHAGLAGLSDYVNRRTAATLVTPDAVRPGQDDLSFYPLLYWPIVADAPPLDQPAIAALNDYMARGGIVLIDLRGGSEGSAGSGAGFAPGTEAALRQFTRGLSIPPLAALTSEHVLARSFYLLSDFPGRFTGATVWVQRDQDRANDSVSPVIIGANDWAAAWAIDEAGRNPYATIPGGARQRVLAYRFGVNLVMYALTGNYKGDQVHVPAILQRLGQ
jgi:hypothetical protein